MPRKLLAQQDGERTVVYVLICSIFDFAFFLSRVWNSAVAWGHRIHPCPPCAIQVLVFHFIVRWVLFPYFGGCVYEVLYARNV